MLPAGERGILIEAPDLAEVLAVNELIKDMIRGGDEPWTYIVDIIPAAVTVYVSVDDAKHTNQVGQALFGLTTALSFRDTMVDRKPDEEGTEVVEVPVIYDGPDLADVAELTGLSIDEVIAAHTATPWRMAFGGFAPGFGYLVDGDPRLEVARRSSPRTAVPAGAVGLAGRFSGIYPRESPGGWQLIGRTSTPMWDPNRTPPALLQPGWFVKFVQEG